MAATPSNSFKLPIVKTELPQRLVKIEDNFGNSIEIPTTGIVSPFEYKSAMALMTMFENSNQVSKMLPMFEEKIVLLFLRSRLDIPKAVTDAEILEPITVPLLKALAGFFYEELGMPEDLKNNSLGIPTIKKPTKPIVLLDEVAL